MSTPPAVRVLLAAAVVLLAAPVLAAPAPVEAPCAIPLAGPTAAFSQTCFGIRPGAALSAGGGCSFNFVFADATRLYAGTAGHCGEVGDRVRIRDPQNPSDRIAVGTIVFSSLDIRDAPPVTDVEDLLLGDRIDVMNTAVGTDFALIRVDVEDEHLVDPQMCYWGGPTGAYDGDALDQTARHYGQGMVVGSSAATRPRTALVTFLDETSFGVNGAVAPGDSGSGIRLATGEALGIITHGGPPSPQGSADTPQGFLSDGYGTRIGAALAMARAAGFDIELVTAPLLHEDGSVTGAWPDPFGW